MHRIQEVLLGYSTVGVLPHEFYRLTSHIDTSRDSCSTRASGPSMESTLQLQQPARAPRFYANPRGVPPFFWGPAFQNIPVNLVGMESWNACFPKGCVAGAQPLPLWLLRLPASALCAWSRKKRCSTGLELGLSHALGSQIGDGSDVAVRRGERSSHIFRVRTPGKRSFTRESFS